MRQARALAPHTAVILLTAFASVPDAVAAMKDGACDYLVKPVSFEQLEQAAERILAQAQDAGGSGQKGWRGTLRHGCGRSTGRGRRRRAAPMC
jgi:DNA-binding NtrC family response regulator